MVTFETPAGQWIVADPAQKLLARAALPGAYGYDQIAQTFRLARARGVTALQLLPAALPASWMVNNRAPSPVFQQWLDPGYAPAWEALFGLCAGGTSPWTGPDAERFRKASAEVVDVLTVDGHGTCALSKVLALLAPEAVPLMDDAAVALWTGLVATPEDAEHPSAPAEAFGAVMTAFGKAVEANEQALIALARGHTEAVLDAAQVLDRLLWVDSWGWRLGLPAERGKWCRVKDGAVEAVVALEGVPAGKKGAAVDLSAVEDRDFVTRARAALAAAREDGL